MQCEIHPFKKCSFYNKNIDKFQCPLCILPKDLCQQVIESTSLKPLQNTSILDIDLIESLANSFYQQSEFGEEQMKLIDVYQQQILDELQQFNYQAHDTVNLIYEQIQRIIETFITNVKVNVQEYYQKLQKSKQMTTQLNELKNHNTKQCVDIITNLQNLIVNQREESPTMEIDKIKQMFPLISDSINNYMNQISKFDFQTLETTINRSKPELSQKQEQIKRTPQKKNSSMSIVDSSFSKEPTIPIDQLKKYQLQGQKALSYQPTSILINLNLIVVGTRQGSIYLHDAETFEEQFVMENAHKEQVRLLTKSQSNEYIVSCGQDKIIKIWKKGFNQEESSFQIELFQNLEQQVAQVLAMNFIDSVQHQQLKNISILIVGSQDNTIRIFDPIKGHYLFTYSGHTGDVYGVCFSPKLQVIGSASQDKSVRLWDGSSYKYNKQLFKFVGHTDSVTGLCALPDANLILSCSLDKSLRVWDCEKRACLRTINSNQTLQQLKLLQPSIAIAQTFDNKLKLFDYRICAQIHEVTSNSKSKCANLLSYTVDEQLKCILTVEEQHINIFY